MSRVGDESIAQLNARLRGNPTDVAALSALKEKYRNARDYPSLINLLNGWATVAPSPELRADAYYEAGQVLLEACTAPDRALPYFAEALTQSPGHEHAALGYQYALEQMGRFPELAEFLRNRYRQLLDQGQPGPTLAMLSYQLGEIYKDRLGNGSEALRWFARTTELDGTILRALYESRQIYLAAGDPRSAAGLLQREADAEPDPQRRVLLLQELADLYEHDLADLDGAVAALHGALEQAPGNRELLLEYAQMLARVGSTKSEQDAVAYQERAAHVLTALGLDSAGETRISHLTAALKLAPGLHEALSGLESEWAARRLQATDLAPLWVAYLQHAPEGPRQQQRRLALAKAYLEGGQREDALYCLDAPQLRGVPEADELRRGLAAPIRGSAPSGEASPDQEAARGVGSPARERLPRPPPVPTLGTGASLSTVPPKVRAASRAPQPVAADKRPTKRPPPPPHSAVEGAERTPSVSPTPSSEPAPPQEPAVPAAQVREPGRSVAPRRERRPRPRARPLAAAAMSQEELDALRKELQAAVRARRPEDGVGAAERILATDPTDKDAFNYLDTHLRKTRDHRARCELLEQTSAAEALAPETRILRLRESAGLRESRLKDIDGAMALWREIGQLDPESDEPVRNRKRLADRIKRWEALEESLEQELADAVDADQRRDVLRRLCTLHTEQRENPDAAVFALRRLLELTDDSEAEAKLEQTLLVLGDYAEASALMRRRADLATSASVRADVLLQLAEVTRDKLGDLPTAYQVMEEALPLLDSQTEVLSTMADIDSALGRQAQLLDVLTRLCERQSPDAAVATTLRMAQVADVRLGDLDRAIEILSTGTDNHPQHEGLVTALLDVLERAEQYEDLVEVLREQTVLQKDRKRRAALMRQTALVLETRLSDEAGAVAIMESLLKEDEDPQALRYLESRARKKGDAEQLVELLNRRLKVTQDAAQEYEIRMERATLFIEQLGRPADALEDLTQITERLAPADAAALSMLEPACSAAGRFEALAKSLERRLSAPGEGADQVHHARRLSELYHSELPNRRKAISALKRWTELDPSDPEPQRRLRPLLHAQRDHQSLLVTLDALAMLESDVESRLEATIASAQLCAGALGDPEGGFTRLLPAAAQGIEPALDALQSLSERLDRMAAFCDVLQGAGQYARLFRVLERLAEGAQNDGARVEWLRRAARAHLECKQDPNGAEQNYRRLLALREDDEALRFLLGRAREHEQAAAIAEYLGRLASLETDAQVRAELRFEQAALLIDALGQPAAAAACYRQILAESEDDEGAEQGLLRALRGAELHEELVAALEMRLGREPHPEERVALAREIAELYLGPLGRPAESLPALRTWHASAPDERAPLRLLEGLLRAADQVDERLYVLDLLAGPGGDNEERRSACLSAARLLRENKRTPDAALARLLPWVGEINAELDAELIVLSDEGPQLFEQVCSALEQAQRHQLHVHVLERHIDSAASEEEAIQLRRRAARLLAGPLDLPAEAERHYREILRDREDEEALRFQRAQAMQADDPRALAQWLGRLAALSEDVESRSDLRFEQAHILRVRLRDPAAAAEVLRQVVRDAPQFVAALDELSAACQESGDVEGMVECLQQILRLEHDPTQQIELGKQLFKVCREELGVPRRGLQGLVAWHGAAPTDPEPLRLMRPVYEAEGNTTALIDVFDRLSQIESDHSARQEAQLAAGALCARGPEADLDGAFTRLWPLVREDHGAAAHTLLEIAREAGALARLGQLYEQEERYEDLARLLQEQAENTDDEAAQAELYERCAALFAGPLNDGLAAREAYQQLVSLREDLSALRYLAQSARDLDEPEVLVDLLQRIAVATPDAAERNAALMERARMLYDGLGQTDLAIDTLRQLLVQAPEHHEAIDELITVCGAERRFDGLGEGLWAQLRLSDNRLARLDLAKRLVELYEPQGELPDAVQRRAALEAWISADPSAPEPHSALVPLLDPQTEGEQLLQSLDLLARNSTDANERAQAVCQAARLALEVNQDVDGALSRLSPLFLERNQEASALLEELARLHARLPFLAQQYVQRAQMSHGEAASADWGAAMALFESDLAQPQEALEAALRRLAVDTQREDFLSDAERLALRQGDHARLARVYAKLVDGRSESEKKVALCLRASDVFESAGSPQTALEWALLACRVDGGSEAALSRARRLADNTGSHSERMWLCEQRARAATSIEARLQCLLEAAEIAESGLDDREQTHNILASALSLAQRDATLCDQVFLAARRMDEARGGEGAGETTRALLQEQLRIASRAHAEGAEDAYLHTARRLVADLNDRAAAFDALKRGTTALPTSVRLLAALEESASELGRLDGLDAHLARLSETQVDPDQRAALLLRRGRLLSDRLQRFDSAARVYASLLELRPEDPEAQRALDDALRKAGRFQELVRSLERRAKLASSPSEQAALLIEQARVWEDDLRNRARALATFQEASRLDPELSQASEGVERLSAAGS